MPLRPDARPHGVVAVAATGGPATAEDKAAIAVRAALDEAAGRLREGLGPAERLLVALPAFRLGWGGDRATGSPTGWPPGGPASCWRRASRSRGPWRASGASCWRSGRIWRASAGGIRPARMPRTTSGRWRRARASWRRGAGGRPAGPRRSSASFGSTWPSRRQATRDDTACRSRHRRPRRGSMRPVAAGTSSRTRRAPRGRNEAMIACPAPRLHEVAGGRRGDGSGSKPGGAAEAGLRCRAGPARDCGRGAARPGLEDTIPPGRVRRGRARTRPGPRGHPRSVPGTGPRAAAASTPAGPTESDRAPPGDLRIGTRCPGGPHRARDDSGVLTIRAPRVTPATARVASPRSPWARQDSASRRSSAFSEWWNFRPPWRKAMRKRPLRPSIDAMSPPGRSDTRPMQARCCPQPVPKSRCRGADFDSVDHSNLLIFGDLRQSKRAVRRAGDLGFESTSAPQRNLIESNELWPQSARPKRVAPRSSGAWSGSCVASCWATSSTYEAPPPVTSSFRI